MGINTTGLGRFLALGAQASASERVDRALARGVGEGPGGWPLAGVVRGQRPLA